jgi:hypothetical protein
VQDTNSNSNSTYSKNPTGGKTPISFCGATAVKPEDLLWTDAGAKAEAEANIRAPRRKRAMVSIRYYSLEESSGTVCMLASDFPFAL